MFQLNKAPPRQVTLGQSDTAARAVKVVVEK